MKKDFPTLSSFALPSSPLNSIASSMLTLRSLPREYVMSGFVTIGTYSKASVQISKDLGIQSQSGATSTYSQGSKICQQNFRVYYFLHFESATFLLGSQSSTEANNSMEILPENASTCPCSFLVWMVQN